MKYLMSWREDFDDQEFLFSNLDNLKDEIKRIKKLEEDSDGEACIYWIYEVNRVLNVADFE